MDLFRQVEDLIVRERLIPDGAVAVVAVSGGPDSTALFDILDRLAPAHGWRLHVASFDHGWRPESADEVRRVAELAAERGLPCSTGKADECATGSLLPVSPSEHLTGADTGSELPVAHARHSEEAARKARRAFLVKVAQDAGADLIATGHTADDRAETLLLNLFRGAGTSGLGAMPARDGVWVRPLIETRRAYLLTYLSERGLTFVEDPSNADARYLRNRLRRELVPALERFEPLAVEHVARAARVCGAEREALGRYAALLLREQRVAPRPTDFLDGLGAVVIGLRGVRCDPTNPPHQGRNRRDMPPPPAGERADWLDLPEAERWLILRAALRECMRGLEDIDLAAIRRLDALAVGPATAGPQALGCGLACRAQYRLVLLPCRPDYRPWGPTQLAPGRTPIPPAEVIVVVGDEAARLPLHADLPEAGLVVRSRRAGDRTHDRWYGQPYMAKVSDLLQDLGVPRVVRDRVPIFVVNDQPVWLPGVPPAETDGPTVPVGVLVE
ncbi:MAG: tRNA lysidine(34) synthetase TilS [Armatimonadetes bacterium]|nr:tRNA lysidine(34) synthetase TilS [Armatimonadota bacterium]